MKGLKKLILASAITAASTSAFAMQALDDETLAATTGQDGLTISLGTDVSIGALRIHDKDGLTGSNVVANVDYANYVPVSGNARDGSIVITGSTLSGTSGNALRIFNTVTGATTQLIIDTAATDAGAALLHIQANLAATTIELDGTRILVAEDDGSDLSNASEILSFDPGTTLSLGATTLNIDLGNQPTGDLIWGNSTVLANGNGNILELGGLNIVGGSGSIGLSGIEISSTGVGGNYTSQIGIGVNDNTVPAQAGLYIRTSSTDGLNVAVADITLGTAASIGSVYIDNLRPANNTIYVKGH